MKKFLDQVRREVVEYTSTEKLFIFFAMCCNFLVCAEYAMVRPVSNSIFIELFTSSRFPLAWLCVMPLSIATVSIYNRFILKWGSARLFTVSIVLIVLSNITFALFSNSPPVVFAFYVWKESYVLLLFQFVWSLIHANINLSKAKYLYGFFFGLGGIGSVFGSMCPGMFAIPFGSERMMFVTIPIYISLLFSYLKMNTCSQTRIPETIQTGAKGFLHGIKLIGSSRLLLIILLIVVFMQSSVAIMDFQFNSFLEKVFPHKDIRTAHSARIFTVMHLITVLLQFIGAYALIRWFGLKKLHSILPILLAIAGASFTIFPVFPVVCFAFLTFKSLDFSLFGILKEMLYVPLKPDEKFRAKAVIDVVAYRSSKTVASLLILVVQYFTTDFTRPLNIVLLAIALVWVISVVRGLKDYDQELGTGQIASDSASEEVEDRTENV